MGQSRKTQVICMGLSKELRLIARSRSYRVQIKNQISRINRFKSWNFGQWYDVQIIPRTQKREDIPFERVTAISAFRRREAELQVWKGDRISTIINRVVSSGMYKGFQIWEAIRSEINKKVKPKVDFSIDDFWKFYNKYIVVKHKQLETVLMKDLYTWNGSVDSNDICMVVGKGVYINEFKSGTGKTSNATQHSSWERYASPQSIGLRQKYYADASLRRVALQERQKRKNDRLRRLVSSYTNT